MGAKVFEKAGDIGFGGGGKQNGVATFKELGEDAQIAEIGLAGERA